VLRDERCLRCGRKGWPLGLQVHHRIELQTLTIVMPGRRGPVARKVRHSDSGCWHHLDGLETLCSDCHHDEHRPPIEDGQLQIEVAA
jgi:5-methylcytosine-specific restriction endonuclease McrA